MAILPDWAAQLVSLYESGAHAQFILSGNVQDDFLLPDDAGGWRGSLDEFLLRALLPGFDVVLSYDLGQGIRIEQGDSIATEWPGWKEEGTRSPREAVETLSHYFRYAANRARLSGRPLQIACVLRAAQLLAPDLRGALHYDTSAVALGVREWSREEPFGPVSLASFVVTESWNDLHPLLVQNPRAAHIEVPLPSPGEIEVALQALSPECPEALRALDRDLAVPARQLEGSTLCALEARIRTHEHAGHPLSEADLVSLKKELVEKSAGGLIEFIEPDRSLDDYVGQEAVVARLREDLALWRKGEHEALPMGYLLCGPVGTGKTYLAECLAGDAGVPMLELRNFRDRWVGSTESNLERIFRLLRRLKHCYVFVDEADQVLGRRSGTSTDGGVSGRVYSMIADEMSDTRRRGRCTWLLASSRPDLIEVDLKRPGRIDVRLPLLPTTTARESFELLRRLCGSRGIPPGSLRFEDLEAALPLGLTAGAAEALAVKIYRSLATGADDISAALHRCLEDYRPAIARDVMDFQIALALREASDVALLPEHYRGLAEAAQRGDRDGAVPAP